MKVYIGPYINWVGPYQIASGILFFLDKDSDLVHKFGEYLSSTCVNSVCQYFHSKKNRKVQVKLHKYDHWNVFHTIALIALPLLKELKIHKHGSGFVDDSDVPENLRSYNGTKKNEYDTDSNFHLRFEYILDEIIWTMENIVNDKTSDFYEHTECDKNMDINEVIKSIKVDHEGLDAYNKRVQNGCVLFGKYFQNLWD